MFGGRLAGCVAGMMSNAYSTVTGILGRLARFFRRTAYTVTERREHVEASETARAHITNKRQKRCSPEETKAVWLKCEADFHELVSKKEDLLITLRSICNTIVGNPSRCQINKQLRPLQHHLYTNIHDMALLVRGERDLCDAFFGHVENCTVVLSRVYDIGFYFATKRTYVAVPPAIDYQLDNVGREKLELAQKFLSATALPTICDDILRIGGANLNVHVATGFVDQVILDLQAIQCDIPVPSFVASEEFHEQLRQLFPRPQRTDLNWNLLLPGSFPRDEEEELAQQETEETPPPPTSTPPIITPPRTPSPPPVIAKTRTSRFYADWLEAAVSGLTPKEFNSKFYQESDDHRLIQARYITDFEVKELGKSADAKRPRSILRNPRARTPPKRLVPIRHPKAVRFTETTLSPRPRSHVGLDVPRLTERDEERKNDAPAVWNPIGLRPVTVSNNMFVRKELGEGWVWPQEEPETLKKLSPEEVEREMERQAAETEERIQELLAEPTVPGLSIRPPREILQSLIQQGKIDLTYKLAVEAKQAEEETKLKAAEEAKRAEEEAKKAEEEDKRRAVEDAKRREVEEIMAQTGGLRPANIPLIAPLSEKWMHEVQKTMDPGSTRLLANTPEGIELRRHDFLSLVQPTNWLNDEIINGSLMWLDRAINGAAGIKDFRRQTRKCLVMSSFFIKHLQDKGVNGCERTLRRHGANKDNVLDMETIIWPICENQHWTVLVICPSKRKVAHMDSLNAKGNSRVRKLGLACMKQVLKERFVESEWQEVVIEAPTQTNGYDCGVFTITNAMCVALGLSPIHSYDAKDMGLQRHRIAAMLLKEGFKGEFGLQDY